MLTAIEIGRRVAKARKQKGVSQAQVAQHLAVSPQAVGKWERGESLPDIITLDRLAQYLGIDLNAFSESSENHSLYNAQATDTTSSKEHLSANASEPKQGASKGVAQTATTHEQECLTEPSDIPKWDLSFESWKDSDFSGMHNLAERLKGSNVTNCQFVGSALRNLELSGSNLFDSSFNKADLSDSLFKGCGVVRCSFDETRLNNAAFKGSIIVDCSFTAAELVSTTLEGCAFKRCKLENALLKNTTFRSTNLSGITLSGELSSCIFDTCVHSNTVFKDAHLTNTFFKGKGLKKIQFIDCTVDSITYMFLKNAKVKLDSVTVVD